MEEASPMFEFLPIPTWDSLHPLVVHMPIGLLLVAPVFMLLGALLPPGRGKPYLIAAWVLMLLGTVSTFVAIETGEAAARLADRTPAINAVLEHHEELAEQTRLIFSILTVALGIVLVAPRLLRKQWNRTYSTILPLIVLGAYAAGMAVLANTGHNGARLVHEFGVHALVQPSTPPPPQAGD